MAYDLRAVGDSLATLLSVRVDLPIRQNSPPIFTVRPLTFWPQLVVWKRGRWGARGTRISGHQKNPSRRKTKRNEKRVKDALPRQKLSVAKQSRAGQDGRVGKVGEWRGGKATLRLQMAWRKQEQQQHANDNVVALREAPTETSGWERRECGGEWGDPQNR